MNKIGPFLRNTLLLVSIGAVVSGCVDVVKTNCGSVETLSDVPISLLRADFVKGDEALALRREDMAVVTRSGVEVWQQAADGKLSRAWTINQPTNGVASPVRIVDLDALFSDVSGLLLGTETGFRHYLRGVLQDEYTTPSKPLALSTLTLSRERGVVENAPDDVVVVTENETLIYMSTASKLSLRDGQLGEAFRIPGRARSMAVQYDQLVVVTDTEVLRMPVDSVVAGQTAAPTRTPLPSGRWWPQPTEREDDDQLFVRFDSTTCELSVGMLGETPSITTTLPDCDDDITVGFDGDRVLAANKNHLTNIDILYARRLGPPTTSFADPNMRIVGVSTSNNAGELWVVDATARTITTYCASESDAGVADAGMDARIDASSDTGVDSSMDANLNDAAISDSSIVDSSTVDSSTVDSSTVDSSTVDSSTMSDAAMVDATVDSSMPCTGALLASPTSSISLRIDNTDVEAGDLNRDGFLDAVVTARQSNQVSVLLGNGDGTFRARVDYATGQNPLGLALGDLNNDGHLDVVTAQAVSGGGSVGVRLGSMTGALGARTDFDAGTGTNAVAIADLNRDGNADVLATNSTTDNLSIFLGNGTGTLAAPVNYETGDGPMAIQTGFFTSDAILDVAVVNSNSNQVSIFIGSGTGALSPMTNYAIEPGATALSLGDLNGDGLLDVVVAHSFGPVNPSVLSLLLGNGDGTLQARTTLATARFPNGVQVVDMNLDGRNDLVVGGAGDGSIGVHLGSSTGGFQALQTFGAGGPSSGPGPLAVGDFNAGSRPDVFVLLTSDDRAAVLLSTCP